MVKNTLLVHPKEIYVQNEFKCSFFHTLTFSMLT